jgi:ribosomal protein S18 acetylase RimI-like enzyme
MYEEDRPGLLLAVPAVDDAAKLARLKAETFVEPFGDSNDPITLDAHVVDTFTVEKVAADLADPNCSTLWVLDAGEPVGYMKMNLAPAQSEPALAAGLEVEQIYFRRSHQGRGLGRMLIDRAADAARENGLPFVWLGVWEHNDDAIAFYERMGCRVCGDHTFRLGDEDQRDLLMRLDLASDVADS